MKNKEFATEEKKIPRKNKQKKKIFIKPFRKILIDYELYFAVNLCVMYFALLLTKDTNVAMLAVIWIGILAWRGGVLAGFLGCVVIYISTILAMNIPPHREIPMVYYFDNKIPGIAIGLIQSLVISVVVGYISTLIHKLRDEIRLREKIQKDLEHNVAELDAFGHTVAHDLKNPLMIVNMSVDSIMRDLESSTDEKIKKKLAFVNEGTKNMVNIIDSILMFAGLKKIDKRHFDSFSVVESVEDALKRLDYNIKTGDVTVKKPENWPSVFGYAPWIAEVWANYISNAIKYGGKPKLQVKPVIELGYDKPEIDGTSKREYIRFWVKDNGEGIPKEKADALFKEFIRLHTREIEGHGLGLSIAKSIVEKLSGTVGVESEIGKGSLFYFTLPVKDPHSN